MNSGYRPSGFSNWSKNFKLHIGDSSYSGWEGSMYFLAVYNKALSSEEIAKNYSVIPYFKNIDENNYEVFAYPNPSRGMMNVRIVPNTIRETTNRIQLRITDSFGQTVREEVIPDGTRSHTEDLNLSNETPGIYHLTVFSNDEIIKNIKLVVVQ
jgi:hypothetical protein